MPDGLGHSVGVERFELLAKLAGNEVSSFTYFTFSFSGQQRISCTINFKTFFSNFTVQIVIQAQVEW